IRTSYRIKQVIRACASSRSQVGGNFLLTNQGGQGMTRGTSAHGDGLSNGWTDAGQDRSGNWWRWRTVDLEWQIGWMRGSAGLAPPQLLLVSVLAGLVLGLAIATGRPAADGGSGGLSALHLAALVAACTLAALIAMRPSDPVTGPSPR